MPDFYRHLLHVFCCMPHPRTGDNHNSESLSTLPAPTSAFSSPLSVPIPHDTVPPGSSESNTDNARALHHIFSSSSSVRGYQTAATTPAFIPTSRPSLDQDFKFGSDLAKSRPETPIEKLGRHIRQKLSKSRIVRASSNKDADSPELGLEKMGQSSPLKHEIEAPLGERQSNAGLTDILASRTASQGGYDSDAHTIASPMVRSKAGTIKVSAGFVKQALGRLEPDKDTAGTTPPPSAQGNNDRTMDHHFLSRSRVQSAPIPTTLSKTSSFIAELMVGTNESPSDVLRRLSVGVANGTIKMPSSSDTRGIQVLSVDESGSPLHLSAPPRTSSLAGLDPKAREKLKRLSEKFLSVKRDSMLSVNENQTESLLSELDLALVEYIGKFAEETATAQVDDAKQESHTHGQGDWDDEPHSPAEVPIRQPGQEAEMSKPVIHSIPESDSDSVHLFNMRISQRLASQSQLAFSSPVASKNASTKSLTISSGINSQAFGRGSITNLTRYPTLIASEHNRRPSDPETKKLFEDASSKKRSNAPFTWRSVTSVHSGSMFSDAKDKFALAERDDANSSYWSDGDVGDSRFSSSLVRTRRNSIQNPHSLAVGGRSVSEGFSSAMRAPSSSLVIRASQSVRRSQHDPRDSADSQNAPNQHPRRGRSANISQKKQTRQGSSPTPVPRYLRDSTDIAENISEVGLERVLDRRNEGITEISAQEVYDKRNEQLSEVDHRHLFVSPAMLSPSLHEEKVRRSLSPHRLGGELHRSRFRPPANLQRSLSEDAPGSIRECGTIAWERAFRQAQEDTQVNSAGNFLTAPKYDRDDRPRRSLGISASEEGSPLGQRASVEGRQRRSQSVGYSRRRSSSADVDAHQQMCSAAKGALPRSGPAITTIDRRRKHFGSYTMKEKAQPRKRSILELGRKFTSVSSTPNWGKSNSPASLKDLLGIWGRFPSHTREERNGSATAVDNVVVQDFVPSAPEAGEDSTPGIVTKPDPSTLNASAFKRLQLKANRRMDRSKSKSMTLGGKPDVSLSSAERARRSRKGILGKWKKLQRSSSSELRKYTNVHGHRSSLSVGDSAEYTELECLPGEGLLRETDLHKRQGLDCSFGLGNDGGPSDEMTPLDYADRIEHKERPDWARAYENCVGSSWALRSDADGEGMSMGVDEGFTGRTDRETQSFASLEVRKSALDVHRQLEENQAKAGTGLDEKLEHLGKREPEGNDKADNAAATVEQESQSVVLEKSKQERPSTDIKIPAGFGL